MYIVEIGIRQSSHNPFIKLLKLSRVNLKNNVNLYLNKNLSKNRGKNLFLLFVL